MCAKLNLGYVVSVLDDAKAYANHAKKKTINLDDVKLAVSICRWNNHLLHHPLGRKY